MSSLGIFFFCFIPRLIYLLIQGNVQSLPSSLYWRLSESLLRYHTLGFEGRKSTGQEFLYPAFLAFFRWLTRDNFFIVMLLQITMVSVAGNFFYQFCLERFKNQRTALIALGLYAFYPYLIRQSAALSEVSLLTTLLILFTYTYSALVHTKRSIVSGVILGLTLLARASMLPLALLSLFGLILKKRFLDTCLIGGAAVIILVPLTLRNYHLNGSLFPTRSGYNLLKGNSEYSDQFIPALSVDLLNPYLYRLLKEERPDLFTKGNEKEIDSFFTEKAVQFMVKNPWRTLKLKFRNIIYFFHFRLVPFQTIPRRWKIGEGTHSLCYGFIFLTSLGGMVMRRRELSEEFILGLIILSFTIVHSLYWPATRLRAPMDFVLMFYSACALNQWLGRFGRKAPFSGTSGGSGA